MANSRSEKRFFPVVVPSTQFQSSCPPMHPERLVMGVPPLPHLPPLPSVYLEEFKRMLESGLDVINNNLDKNQSKNSEGIANLQRDLTNETKSGLIQCIAQIQGLEKEFKSIRAAFISDDNINDLFQQAMAQIQILRKDISTLRAEFTTSFPQCTAQIQDLMENTETIKACVSDGHMLNNATNSKIDQIQSMVVALTDTVSQHQSFNMPENRPDITQRQSCDVTVSPDRVTAPTIVEKPNTQIDTQATVSKGQQDYPYRDEDISGFDIAWWSKGNSGAWYVVVKDSNDQWIFKQDNRQVEPKTEIRTVRPGNEVRYKVETPNRGKGKYRTIITIVKDISPDKETLFLENGAEIWTIDCYVVKKEAQRLQVSCNQTWKSEEGMTRLRSGKK